MSTDRGKGGSHPGSLGGRMQSALSDATSWVSTALTGEIREDEDDAAGRSTDSTDEGSHGSGGPAGEVATPEERVVELVADHGGSMRQGEVVSAVEWSESTVSRKLSKLEADGAVTRYRIGREKLVFLPGHEPESFASPWGDVAAEPSGSA